MKLDKAIDFAEGAHPWSDPNDMADCIEVLLNYVLWSEYLRKGDGCCVKMHDNNSVSNTEDCVNAGLISVTKPQDGDTIMETLERACKGKVARNGDSMP